MIVVKGGVTAPKGFMAGGVRAGLKKSGRPDLALLYSDVPAAAAGAFTANRFKASPVKVSMARLKNRTHQAIIVNSGNANCALGRAGDRDAERMASLAARALALQEGAVLVASTGIIGRRLDVGKIEKAIPALIGSLSKEGASAFSGAILTTDTKRKESAVKVKIGRHVITLGGSCKGVGMIYPNLVTARHATMLCFVTTDACITKRMLEKALAGAAAGSYNMISVDGDMSTNDSCFVLANGLAGNRKIASAGSGFAAFTGALSFLLKDLARMTVLDGEGATKLIEIEVTGAKNDSEAGVVARKISTSNLLKACVHGGDPNWGRVAAAAGASAVEFDPDKVDIFLGGVKVLSGGAGVAHYDTARAKRAFSNPHVYIRVDLKRGRGRAAAWTCDLSKKYVEINAEYST